jgi:hypothetical protein
VDCDPYALREAADEVLALGQGVELDPDPSAAAEQAPQPLVEVRLGPGLPKFHAIKLDWFESGTFE